MSFDDPDSEPDPDRPRGTRPPRRPGSREGGRPVSRDKGASVPGRNRLHVVVTDGRGRVRRAVRLRRWLAAVAPPAARGEVAVALVCDRKMRDLNRRYRGIDRATDVLSFPATSAVAPDAGSPHRPDEPEASSPAPVDVDPHLGDIVIATGVARRQARAAGHPLGAELRCLALHGLLHLLGYDHERDTGQMERLERRLRQQGGLA